MTAVLYKDRDDMNRMHVGVAYCVDDRTLNRDEGD